MLQLNACCSLHSQFELIRATRPDVVYRGSRLSLWFLMFNVLSLFAFICVIRV
jgi:hypothetical protein